jgi:multidrug resistance efflux pump
MTVLERQATTRADASPAEPPLVGSRAEVVSSAAHVQVQSPLRAAAPIAPATAPTATATVESAIESTVAPAFAPAPALDERIASSRVLKVQAAHLQATGFVAGQQALVAAVARHYQFDRVSLGWVRSKGVVVQAISQTVVARLATEAMAPCVAAMHEAFDQEATVLWPTLPDSRPLIVFAHGQLARQTGAQALCTVLLATGGQCIALLTCERDHGPIDQPLVDELQHLAAFVAPMLLLGHRAAHPMADAGERLKRLLPVGGSRRGLAAAAVAAGLAALVALAGLEIDSRISAPARVEGAVQRVLTAPADGFLLRVAVRPGDTVKADQILVELDDRDLSIERLRWATDSEQEGRQATEALAREDRVQFAAHAAKAEQARAQLALVDAQLSRFKVSAPFDGIVLQGDLTRSLGAPVRSGDTLITVAPAGEYRVILEVDEYDIGRLAGGESGVVSLAASSGAQVPVRVTRVSPTSIVRDGRNVFEVEAQPLDTDAALRPGFQGMGRIQAGQRSLWRIVAERPWLWLRQQLWGWGL